MLSDEELKLTELEHYIGLPFEEVIEKLSDKGYKLEHIYTSARQVRLPEKEGIRVLPEGKVKRVIGFRLTGNGTLQIITSDDPSEILLPEKVGEPEG